MEDTACIQFCLGVCGIKDTLPAFPMTGFFPLSQYNSINISRVIGKIIKVVLINKISPPADRIYFKRPNSMMKEVDCTKSFACYFVISECLFPLFPNVWIGNN